MAAPPRLGFNECLSGTLDFHALVIWSWSCPVEPVLVCFGFRGGVALVTCVACGRLHSLRRFLALPGFGPLR